MTEIKKIDSLEKLKELKIMYIEETTAPLDGMWLCGFVPAAKHFGVYEEDKLKGYFCINEEGYLLQYILGANYKYQSEAVFKTLLETKNSEVGDIKGAFCSTAEPGFMSLCLDNFRSHKVNALMYKQDKSQVMIDKPIELNVLKENHLKDVIAFAHEAIGAPVDWLHGYYSNLIKRAELYASIQNDRIIATGECRGYDEYQTSYADLGVIVAKEERSKGIATKVLKSLSLIAKDKNLIPICSTEASNLGAQRAISRAGFFAHNRIIQFD